MEFDWWNGGFLTLAGGAIAWAWAALWFYAGVHGYFMCEIFRDKA